jgi:glycosyltransferase involved in cell wall biosynthesis
MSESLRIVQFHNYDVGGGAEAVARLNWAALNDAGHYCSFFVGRKRSDVAAIREIPRVKGFPGLKRLTNFLEAQTGLQYLYSPSFRAALASVADDCDVVHLHSLHGAEGWADLYGVAQVAKRFPTVLTLHDGWLLTGHCLHGIECERWKIGCGVCPDLQRYPAVPKDATALNFWRKKRLFANHRLHCIAPSQWVVEQMKCSPILRQTSVDVVPNPIDTSVFHAAGRENARRSLNIPADHSVILMAASHLNAMKGGELIQKLVQSLGQQSVIAILIGHGSIELAGTLSCETRPMGYVASSEKMAECYRAADVVIVPSKVETFGLVAAEAVACGASVASFHAGGLREVMAALHQISVNDGDIKQLREVVIALLKTPQQRTENIQAGQKYIQHELTPARHAERCVEVYRKVIQRFQEKKRGIA